jgi:hypothetical protein
MFTLDKTGSCPDPCCALHRFDTWGRVCAYRVSLEASDAPALIGKIADQGATVPAGRVLVPERRKLLPGIPW